LYCGEKADRQQIAPGFSSFEEAVVAIIILSIMSSFKLEFSSSTEGIVKNDMIKCFGDDAHEIFVFISKVIKSNIALNYDTSKALVKDYLKRYQSTSSKLKMKLICWTALVHILKLCSPSYDEVKIHSIQELRATYPAIINKLNDAKELGLFLEYCNSLRMALRVLSAKNNKKLLIDISSRLEGLSSKTYITGSGQSSETRRRVEVYEQEGGELPIPKRSRRSVEQDERITPCDATTVIMGPSNSFPNGNNDVLTHLDDFLPPNHDGPLFTLTANKGIQEQSFRANRDSSQNYQFPRPRDEILLSSSSSFQSGFLHSHATIPNHSCQSQEVFGTTMGHHNYISSESIGQQRHATIPNPNVLESNKFSDEELTFLFDVLFDRDSNHYALFPEHGDQQQVNH